MRRPDAPHKRCKAATNAVPLVARTVYLHTMYCKELLSLSQLLFWAGRERRTRRPSTRCTSTRSR